MNAELERLAVKLSKIVDSMGQIKRIRHSPEVVRVHIGVYTLVL